MSKLEFENLKFPKSLVCLSLKVMFQVDTVPEHVKHVFVHSSWDFFSDTIFWGAAIQGFKFVKSKNANSVEFERI